MTNIHKILIVTTVAIVTALIRFAPFIIFRKEMPKTIEYLNKVLPYAVIGMLVIYCLKDTNFEFLNTSVPQLTAVAVTIIAHKIKHSMLLSISLGTACYMLLVHLL